MNRARFNGPAGWIHHTGGIYTISGAGPLDPADVIRWTPPAQRIDVRAWFTVDERRAAAVGILAGTRSGYWKRPDTRGEPPREKCFGLID